jgi:hypothetical protein
MKIAVAGSSQYKDMILMHTDKLRGQGHSVRTPAFDDFKKLDDLGVCKYNLEVFKWADRIDIIWDQRSVGFIFDFGMIFALDKPVKIVYLESKTFPNMIKKYEAEHKKKSQ